MLDEPQITVAQISEALNTYQIKQSIRSSEILASEDFKKLRRAAIIIPLLINNGEWHVLLTHRSSKLIEHSGQVAFPGGAWESIDSDLQATALREMYEEIGVLPQDVDVLGYLGDMPVISGYLVRLFVGRIPWPYQLVLNHYEVESSFTVPLHWLADPNHRTMVFRSYAGREFPVIYFEEYDGHVLWGASAEMTMYFLNALNLVDSIY